MGALSGSIPWASMNIMGKKVKFFHSVDDVLGVFHTHAVAGVVGGFMTGILATTEGSAAFAITNPGGAIYGNGRQVWVQVVSALFVIGWNIVWTSLIMCFIKYVLRVPLRMSEEQLLLGDDAIHGESAYNFDEMPSRSLLYGDTERKPIDGDGERGVSAQLEPQAASSSIGGIIVDQATGEKAKTK